MSPLAMAMRTTPAMNALTLLLLGALVLVLLPGASVADGDEAAMEALFARIREVQSASKSGLEELQKFNGKAPQDLVRSAEVESVVGDVDLAEEVAVERDAAADLFAHIYEVQRKSKLANEERAELDGDGSEDSAGEGVGGGGDEEEEEEIEQVGVEDPLAQERFKELEATLKTLTNKAVDSQEEPGVHDMQLNAPGLKGEDVINLLHKYAQEMHEKIYPMGVGLESQQDDDHSREADGENVGIDDGHSNNHDDHGHLHSHTHDHGHGHHHHDHDHGHGHHHRDHGHEDAHANVGFSRASDAHYHNHDHSGHSHGHDHGDRIKKKKFVLPEEIAEEEDLLQYGFEGQVYSSAEQPRRWRSPDSGVWLRAMGCSLLVSLASLICLMLLPCIVSNGKPSVTVVNALASFGAGAMLGDAFLHQLPHAFSNSGFSHSHDAHHHDHGHSHSHSHDHDHSPAAGHGHAHSLKDLSIGLAVLGGILLFFIVEKIVRRYEELSNHGGQRALGHTHHHHQKKDRAKKLEGSEKSAAVGEVSGLDDKELKSLETRNSDIKKRKSGKKKDTAAVDSEISSAPTRSPQQVDASGGFVIGYLNLFSDAVHNFTDGMALGSAFLLHGTVGGWSRTLFLLAHELPQEVGDFGILVKSGFSVFEALAFNFLSALVALAGTAVALMLGGNTGHSSLIEGFIAGGFIYMSVGGVMPSMHDQGSSLISTLSQVVPMVLGMGVAVVISLAE